MNDTVFRLSSQELSQDPVPELQRLLNAGPVVTGRIPLLGKIATLTTWPAVDEFLRDSDHFVRDPAKAGKTAIAGLQWWMPRMLTVIAQNMMAYDGEQHRRLRQLVEQAFVRRNVDSMRPRVEEITQQLLERMATEERQHGHVDFLEHFARPLPLIVICELLGLPDSDRPRFTRWFAPISRVGSALGFLRLVPGMWNVRRYLIEQIRQCRRQPRDGLISALIEAEDSGDQLTDDELLAMVFLLLVAGHETTTHLLTCGLLTLLDHPDQTATLTSDWSLAESAVSELLRYTSPVQFCKPRYAAEDMDLYGRPIRRGEMIIGCLASANLDPQEFPDPTRFDIRRAPNRHLTFGRGIHTCLGLRLAQLETQVAYEQLFTRFPQLRLAVDRTSVGWNQRVGMRTLSALPLKLT